ncbi:hypothetical protein CEV34_5243B, partial [Brucella pseudogrignonensis]
ALYWVA